MQLTHDTAQRRLSELHMDDMPVMEIRPTATHVDTDWFTKYKKLCHEFMESLTDSIDELAFLNLSQNEFMALIMGRAMPQNLSIRFRVPLVWGGKLETDNLFLCQTFPHSQRLDRFIIEQHGAETIWLPNPAKRVYVSVHESAGGDGGNATTDRLSQMAAQIGMNRSME